MLNKSGLVIGVSIGMFLTMDALAKTPPPSPRKINPPVWDRTGAPEQDRGRAIFDGPTRNIGPGLFTTGTKLPPALLPRRPDRGVNNTTTAETTIIPSVVRRSPLRTQTSDVPSEPDFLYTGNATPGGGEDVEPALVSLTKYGVGYTVTANSRYNYTNYRVRAQATNDHISWFGQYEFPVGAGFNESGDPVVAANVRSTGVRPEAVYAAFFSGYRPDATSGIQNPMNIVVWGSDDGGATWNSSSVAVQTSSSTGYELDKPAMDVSWFEGDATRAGTAGYIYVAWVEEYDARENNRVTFRRNTGGLWTRCRAAGGGCVTSWDPPVVIAESGENAGNPQVVVNQHNGDVYVFWLNFYGEIKMRRSVDAGVTFGPAVTVIHGINLVYGNNGTLPNNLRAIVVPSIKYDTYSGRVVATWHGRTQPEVIGSPTNETAVYFASFDPAYIPYSIPGHIIYDVAGTDLQPSHDNDTAGRILITFLSTQNDPNFHYLYAMCTDSYGNVIWGCGPTTPQSWDMPAEFQNGPWPGTKQPNGFVGDYRDTFYWSFPDVYGWRWHASWTAASRYSYTYDTAVSGIR